MGRLIAVEGIDQAGKQTVCEHLVEWLRQHDVRAESTGFPDYTTRLGQEIATFLRGDAEYPPEARQLLYVANRWERAKDIRGWLAEGRTIVVDRYIASGIAYGAAHGLDLDWMIGLERGLPAPDVTLLLDISPEVSLARKQVGRDAYEAKTELLAQAREIYLKLARMPGWHTIDASGERGEVWSKVRRAVEGVVEAGAWNAKVEHRPARFSGDEGVTHATNGQVISTSY